MPRPKFRIVCCLCGKPIPQSQDVYALDAEWQRRFPTMVGTLSCGRCAVSDHVWHCRTPRGTHVPGHHVSERDGDRCHDSWDHITSWGTHVAMVLSYPWSGLWQGAEEYLRYAADRRGLDATVAGELREILDRWDNQTPTDHHSPATDRVP